MRDLHDQEDDLLREMEANMGSLTSYDFDDMDEDEYARLNRDYIEEKRRHLKEMKRDRMNDEKKKNAKRNTY